ncbi:DUF4440 domain-containing protein [Novosphingobium umbonatum]|uniref:DUF4440 domain-containing protein n=2 Tax=Novosphingobium umbonatum TaxID=1908524 RepID=A0A437NDH8_9SPHN|nr:DUF4440 domain-containing protein [Novosphingobium umbonatum]
MDLAIRMARAAFNRALEQGDLAAITPLLAHNVTLVTGTDSALLNGRKAQLLAWKREFSAPAAQRNTYIRKTQSVMASTTEPLAMEYGAWEGVAQAGITAQGAYSAKWRRMGESWVIEAEIFVTL